MTARALMFMGTGSDVGKSLIMAGLCRAFARRGLRVAPFKPQNMSNNAAVTSDGGEIGRAQALQARAALRPAVTAMNPVLLKPEHESGAQVILRGKRLASMPARQYWSERGKFLPAVLDAFDELAADVDLVLVEGAGSASEVNLRAGDIANFGFARALDLPVVVVGDIHRGGVIAALVGTLTVIDPEDAKLIVATLVNRFEGDATLFAEGRAFIAARTGRPCLGPVPYFSDAQKLPAEDVLALEAVVSKKPGANFVISVLRLPRIANFDDLDPIRAEPFIELRMIGPGTPIPLETDMLIIPGSKATRADLAALRAEGWDIDMAALRRNHKTRFLGICGGYQMLGNTISDPDGIEGDPGTSQGLGLLDVDTVLTPTKQLRFEHGTHAATKAAISGYRMHMGHTEGGDRGRPFAWIEGEPEGAVSPDGQVCGTYLHGLFASDPLRRALLGGDGDLNYESGVEETLDRLASHLESFLDLDALLAFATQPRRS